MRVSDYLQPVLDAALDHAETVAVFDDSAINQTVRDRLAAERNTDLQAAWAEALAAVRQIRGETVDADWTAWRPQGVRTSAYRAWRAGQTARTELSSAQIAVLYYDVQVTDTSAPRIIHPSKINIDLKPVVTSLITPAMRPANLAEIALFARNRLDAGLGAALSEIDLWELWRRAGGDRRPEYLSWLSRRRRGVSPPAGATTAVAVAPPGAPGQFSVLRPAVLIPPVPDPSDFVTSMQLRYRVTGFTPRVPGEPTDVRNAAFAGATAYGGLSAFPVPRLAICVYYTTGTDDISRVTGMFNRGALDTWPCAPPQTGEDPAESISLGGHFFARRTTVHIKPRTSTTEPRPFDVVNAVETIPWDGSAAAYARLRALTVPARSNSAGVMELSWTNLIGTGPATTARFAASPPPEAFGRPSWVSVADDDTASPRVQRLGIMAAVQYAPVPNNQGAQNARQGVVVVAVEQGGGTAELFAQITRASPVAHLRPDAAALARGNDWVVTYRNGTAADIAAAKALPQLASFAVDAADQPFYIAA